MRRATATDTRFHEERGAAMIIAVIVLMIISTLATVAVAVAVQTDSSTRRDSYKKNALEAAEAGLQIALYRMNMLRPDDLHCLGDTVLNPDSTGWCASSTTTLGNGSTYRYYTTPLLSTAASCVGLSLTNTVSIGQRCVTSIGTTNGVSARSQVRVAAFQAAPLFPIAGITGLKDVTFNGNPDVHAWGASNGVITAHGNVSVLGTELGPAGSLNTTGNVSIGSNVRLSNPIVLGPVDPGTSNQTSLANCPARQTAGYPACNDNYRITNGLASPTVTPYDQSSGVSYDAVHRVLSLSGNSSLTLGGGLYNFCNVSISGNATITVGTTVKTAVYIDSPDDPNSGCQAGTGHLTVSGNAEWNNKANDPTALQLYVYGQNNGSNVVTLNGNTNFDGIVYAPQSAVNLNGNIAYFGAISGNHVTLNGNSFTWDSRAGTLQAHTTGLYYRTAWAQCTPSSASSDPGAGCG
jgi:Tfp pilus assembly protein PilX